MRILMIVCLLGAVSGCSQTTGEIPLNLGKITGRTDPLILYDNIVQHVNDNGGDPSRWFSIRSMRLIAAWNAQVFNHGNAHTYPDQLEGMISAYKESGSIVLLASTLALQYIYDDITNNGVDAGYIELCDILLQAESKYPSSTAACGYSIYAKE